MSDPSDDRAVVSGSDGDGPVMPGSSGAGPEAAADTPVSGGDPYGGYVDPHAGRMAGEDAPKSPNQEKTEPMPPSGSQDQPAPAAGGRHDGDAGTSTGLGPREGWATAPPGADTANAQGMVPGETPAEGTSEGMAPIEGVTFPAVAPEGLADGEPDAAMPSTTHF